MSGLQDHVTLHTDSSTTMKNETRVLHGRTPDNVPRETLSPSSVMDTWDIEENPTTSGTKELDDPGLWDQINVPGLWSSMSMSILVNHIGHYSGQSTPGNHMLQTGCSIDKSALEELTQYLLGDSQVTSASDEQSLMSRANSLCCLIQHNDTMTVHAQTPLDKNPIERDTDEDSDDEPAVERKLMLRVSEGGEWSNDASSCKPPSMSRNDSYGELLMHLPRIVSLPQFSFNIDEKSEIHR